MNLKSQAGIGIFVTCLASAAMVSPAAAVPEAPVVLPLQGLGTVLPVEPPTVRTGVPIPMPGTPMGLGARGKGGIQKVLVPQVPVSSGLPKTEIAAPVPDVVGSAPIAQALLTAPGSDLEAITPGAAVGAPLTLPRPEKGGRPDVVMPEVGVAAPSVVGALQSELGLSTAG